MIVVCQRYLQKKATSSYIFVICCLLSDEIMESLEIFIFSLLSFLAHKNYAFVSSTHRHAYLTRLFNCACSHYEIMNTWKSFYLEHKKTFIIRSI